MTQETQETQETQRFGTPQLATRILVILLSLVPVYVVGVLIDLHAVNIPNGDDWHGSIARFARGDLLELNWEAFWKLQNEHRTFLPQILGAAIAHLTDAHMIVPVWVNLGLTIVFLGMLVRLRRVHTVAPGASLIVLPFSLLVLGLVQWPCWIDPRTLSYSLTVLGTVGAVLIITGGPCSGRRLALAAAMSVLSSLSFFSGNLTWFIVGALLWVVGYRRARYLVTWSILTLAVLVPYTIDFLKKTTRARETPLPELGEFVDFVLVFLGSPMVRAGRNSWDQSAALTMGIVGLGSITLLTWVAHRRIERGLHKALPWLALSSWVILNAAAAAYGRVALESAAAARVPRYAIFSSILWVAVLALIAIVLFEPTRAGPRRPVEDAFLRRALPLSVALIVALGWTDGTMGRLSAYDFGSFAKRLQQGQRCLLMGPNIDDACLANVTPHPAFVRSLLPDLRRRGASFLMRAPSLDMDGLTASSTDVSIHKIDLAGDDVEVLYMPPPSVAGWRVYLPERPSITLRTGTRIGLPSAGGDGPGKLVSFVIDVRAKGRRERVFNRVSRRAAALAGFEPAEIDLTPWAGQIVELILETSADSPTAAMPQEPALWRAPRIVYVEESE